jgi:membrane-bound lytic murein transglycosylase B
MISALPTCFLMLFGIFGAANGWTDAHQTSVGCHESVSGLHNDLSRHRGCRGVPDQGKYSTVRSLATLAYDCRRSEKFRAELLDALRINERGDLTPAQMIGAWAGEVGQTQFLPSTYLKFAVDFEGYGRRDLIHSALNALASTANYLKSYGWTKGQPWTEGAVNFGVLQKWNESGVHTKTVSYFATRLTKEP